MKLTEDIKKRIDDYFTNISDKELFDVAVNKYGFNENIDIDIDNQSFNVIKQSYYSSSIDNSVEVGNLDDTMPLAA